MTYDSPRAVAFFSALAISAISIIVLFISSFIFFYSYPFYVYLVIAGLTFSTVYYIFILLLKKLIQHKIDQIYSTIESINPKETKKNGHMDMSKDVFEVVSVDVLSWAKSKKKEIENLKRLENYRREFIGNVSHELKTPIFNIEGYVHTLIDGALNDNRVNNLYLKKAAKNVERLSAIVQDLEVISQFESGELKLEKEIFDIRQLAEEVVESLEMNARAKGITLSFKDSDSREVFVKADREKIRQVFTNLVVNSIKYGKENGKTLIGIYKMEKHILIEVSDDGIGIAKKDLPRLFERFFRVDKSRSREAGGTGLGLSIVKHIIEAHKQQISVRSQEGIGSTFSFTLKKGKFEQ